MAQPAHPSGGRREPGRDPPRHRHRPGRRPRSRPRRGVGMSTDNHDEQDDEQGTALGARKGDANPEQKQKALDNTNRKSVVKGKRWSVRVDLGGCRIIKKKKSLPCRSMLIRTNI